MRKIRDMKKSAGRPAPAGRTSLPAIEVLIDRIDENGMGYAMHRGKDVQVAGVLAGERAVVEIEHEGRQKIAARLVKLLQKSDQRTSARPCTRSEQCLGCPLITLDYPQQLTFKQEKVRTALRAYPALQQVAIPPVWEAPAPLGYRTNAKLVIGKHRGRVQIGLYRRRSHDIVDIGDCPLHHPLINRIVKVVREEIARQSVYVYNPERGSGLLRYLVVRVSPSRNEAMVTFVTSERNFREVTHLAKWLTRKVPEVVSVQQNVNASAGNVLIGRETLKMLGQPALLDQVGDLKLRISPTSFFQVNHDQAQRIYALVRRWAALRAGESALDLYCGIGGIALNLARDAGRVIGIEVVEEAVRNAADNARLNGLRNCTFRAGDAAELIDNLALEIPPGAVATVNPPRKGCEPAVLEALAALQPRTLIYVSCDPQTLARDLDLLAARGYRTAEVQPVDMFPQTPHVECVARLVPADPQTGE